jgi:hypothetical protein
MRYLMLISVLCALLLAGCDTPSNGNNIGTGNGNGTPPNPDPALEITTATLPDGIELLPYTEAITATGGSGADYTWSISQGTLPAGLTLDATGTPGTELSGTLPIAGIYDFTVRVEDSNGNSATQDYSLVVDPAPVPPPPPPLTITTVQLPVATSGSFYSHDITATGGSGAGYIWSITLGSLSPGMSFDPTGTPSTEISGAPNMSGTFDFTMRVEDSIGNHDTRTYTLHVVDPPLAPPVILTAWLPEHFDYFSSYHYTIQTSGGQGPLSWSISYGTLPPGFTIDPTGTPHTTISGAPMAYGTFEFRVRVEDALGLSSSRRFVITVHPYHWGTYQRVLLVADVGSQSAGSANNRIRTDLTDAVQNLYPGDEFDIVVHSWNHIGGYTALWGALMPATAANIATALAWIQSAALDPVYPSDNLSAHAAWEYSFTNYTDVEHAVYLSHRLYSWSNGPNIPQDLYTWMALDPFRHCTFIGVEPDSYTDFLLKLCATATGGSYVEVR